MSPALNILGLSHCKRCWLAVADRRHDELQEFSLFLRRLKAVFFKCALK